ncbi:hypothetical protein [Rhodophyticola porphyridii]|uniref:hypothetical protein n=1 Tax=Rhodophyticola porphyridii TaxID=1852017 RepID=UPI0035CED54B
MLELDIDLPPGARADAARPLLREQVAGAGGVWLEGVREAFATDAKTGAVTAWHDGLAGRVAHPTAPNDGHTCLSETDDLCGLALRAGTHCGLVVDKVDPDPAGWTMAVIYLPPETGGARTLLTLNAGSGDGRSATYLFLSDDGDRFTVKGTGGALELTAPVEGPRSRPRLATVTLRGSELAFQENGGAIHSVVGSDPALSGKADLFIGCRSHRSGLLKTLGASVILEVLFWRDHTLLLPRNEADRAQHMALRRYMLWGH